MQVHRVQGSRDRAQFVDLPYRLHAADPSWVPPLRFDVRRRLSARHNPFFEHGEAELFLVRGATGEAIGRIAAVANALHNRVHGDRVGFFGFFECVDDQRAADALFEAAAGWARERGFEVLRGPASFSTNEECGLLVDGFDTPPTLMMAHNPAYYVALVERAGFVKVKDLLAYHGGHPEHYVPVPPRSARAVERLGTRLGLRLRGADPRRLDEEVERIREIYNAVWEHNWGFVPLTDSEIRHMARQFRPFYIPDLVPLAEKDGEVIGFGLAVPDLNQVLRGNRSGRLFPAVVRLLWALRRRKIRRARILLLGVRRDYRGRGVDAMLWHWLWTKAARHGIYWGEASWILEDNPAMGNAAERMGFRRYKTYRLYDRML